MGWIVFFIGVAVGAFLAHVRSRWHAPTPTPLRDGAGSGDSPRGQDALAAPDASSSAEDRVQQLKREIESQDDAIQRPADLDAHAGFVEAVELLSGDGFRADQLLEYLTGSGYVLPSMAGAALAHRDDIDPAAVVVATPQLGAYALHYVLRWLQTLPDARTLPALAVHAREWWWDYGGFRKDFERYLRWASDKAIDPPAHDPAAALEDAALADAKATLSKFRNPLLQPVIERIDAELAGRNEQRVLGGIGRIGWRAPATPRFEHDALRAQVDALHDLLVRERPAPVLLAGERGVGKTVLYDALAQRLSDQGWLLFEAGAADILAGQKYIGELEGRVRDMLGALRRPKALWHVPDFFDLLHKGSHSHDPRGILDLVLPSIERGDLLVVGELSPRQYAQLVLARPVLRHLFELQQVQPADASALAEIVRQWTAAAETRHGRTVLDATARGEAAKVANQFFPDQHEPGRTLRLLDDALLLATQQDPPALPIDGRGLLLAVSARSGLPLDVIDHGQRLSLERLHQFFRKRVVGQDEAIECLVDRIAMLKAGLTDGRRPVGVFLFAGPTGTGKTELAKALGELLFGSDERLLRLDMSEYQAPDAAQRLIAGASAEGGTRSLVSRIREQPFSVVLLDEFEKAHPNVWDLFLQVFDDGRLGDQHGNTADFRHSIIILTSNVGSTISRSAGPGFTASAGGYSRGAVEKALYETFRREFINRLDRVVLFRPLDRAAMRGILHKELERALERRGLRNRGWAVEWEPSAIEFLLDKGFTPDLGARPLRRAIEEHLLAPLARSIVEHRAPEGDQFLFVRGNGDRLEVEFIDPDAPGEGTLASATAPETQGDLRALLHGATDTPPAHAVLDAHLRTLQARVDDADWTQPREADFAAMNADGFWSDPARFAMLDRIERRDRIESALDAATRLLERLRGNADATLSARITQLLFLLELAIDDIAQGRPQDAVLTVSAVEGDLARRAGEARQWWQDILAMYRDWAARRGMRLEVLAQDAEHGRARLSLSGFGALRLLEGEAGLHVLEADDDKGGTQRLTVQVSVAADGPGAPETTPQVDATPPVCRRYRRAPSPLVRDTRRGWRSGRVDRVLGGDFDLMQ